MQIGDAIAGDLEPLPDTIGHFGIGHHVDQHRAGALDQAIGPACDHKAADDADHRIDPDPAVPAGEDQRDNRHDRGGGIGQNMGIGGAQIVVAVSMSVRLVVMMTVIMTVTMTVVVIVIFP